MAAAAGPCRAPVRGRGSAGTGAVGVGTEGAAVRSPAGLSRARAKQTMLPAGVGMRVWSRATVEMPTRVLQALHDGPGVARGNGRANRLVGFPLQIKTLLNGI